MMPKISHRYKKISKIIIQLIDCKINVLNSYHKYGTVNPRKEEKEAFSTNFSVLRIRIYYYADPDQGSTNVHTDPRG